MCSLLRFRLFSITRSLLIVSICLCVCECSGEYEIQLLTFGCVTTLMWHACYMVLMVRDFMLYLNIPLFGSKKV